MGGGTRAEDYSVGEIETYFPGEDCSTSLPSIPFREPVGVAVSAACFINGTLYSSFYWNSTHTGLASYSFSTQSWTSLPFTLGELYFGDPYACVANRIYLLYNYNKPKYFDATDGVWHNMNKSKSSTGYTSAMCEANGSLYVFGGESSSTIQAYNIATNAWSDVIGYISYTAAMSCAKIPGTSNIMVLNSGWPSSYIGIFNTGSNSWLSPQTVTSSLKLYFAQLLIYDTQVYAYDGLEDAFAYCPNSGSWQRVIDIKPLSYPRYGFVAALVPKSLLGLPATCAPASYKCA